MNQPIEWPEWTDTVPDIFHHLFPRDTLQRRETSIFDGGNPLNSVLSLLIIEILLIICLTRVFAVGLAYIKQPRVIAEVLCGLVLGPSVLGLWPPWIPTIFPPVNLVVLKAFADIGLIFFMFLIGVELDPSMLKAHFKPSLIISICGLILPFALSVPLSYLMYSVLMGETSVAFGSFLLFIGVSMSITAFPILARILTDRKLLHTKVGITSISAAAVGDTFSWILLALTIAIVSAGSPLVALYVALTGLGFALFMLFPVKILWHKLVNYVQGKHGEGIDTFLVFAVFAMTLAAAWFTEAIGIHAIFGAFLAGIIQPHEKGFSIGLTEKLEDFVTILLVPLYFAYSGLRTNLTALNDGLVWGIFFLALFVACFGKIVGSAIPSRFLGLTWRESWTVGVLQNTKGLVELIVLNLGLDAKVINERVFVVMVLVALVTTFATTPIVAWIYPQKEAAAGVMVQGALEGIDGVDKEKPMEMIALQAGQMDSWIKEGVWPTDIPPVIRDLETAIRLPVRKRDLNMLVCLTSSHHVAGCVAVTQLIGSYYRYEQTRYQELGISDISPKLLVFALRLVAMSERYSQLMLASEGDATTLLRDPTLSLFRTFTQITHTPCIPSLALADTHEFSQHIVKACDESDANLIVLPWQRHEDREAKTILDVMNKCREPGVAILVDHGFGSLGQVEAPEVVPKKDSFFPSTAPVENDIKTSKPMDMEICCLFLGGKDDREAVIYALRMAAAREAHVTLLRFVLPGEVAKTVETQLPTQDLSNLADQVQRNMELNQLSVQSRASISIAATNKSKWWQSLWSGDQVSIAESTSQPMVTQVSEVVVDAKEKSLDEDLFSMIKSCVEPKVEEVVGTPVETVPTPRRRFSIGALTSVFKPKEESPKEESGIIPGAQNTVQMTTVIPNRSDTSTPTVHDSSPHYDIPFMSKVVLKEIVSPYPVRAAIDEAQRLNRSDLIVCGREGSLRNVDLSMEMDRLTPGIPLKAVRSSTWNGTLGMDRAPSSDEMQGPPSAPLHRPASVVMDNKKEKQPSKTELELLGDLGSRLTVGDIRASMLIFRSPQDSEIVKESV